MRVRLIGDTQDVTGLALAGIDSRECATRAELVRALDDASHDPSVAIVMVSAAVAALGAAYAVAVVGGAAMGAVAEKPETAGRALIFVGLAEGIAIYGIIIAIMILSYVK